MPFLRSLITPMPKAELHMHLEGSLEPEMMFRLAARNGVALPYGSEAELRAAYRFSGLQSFLDIYYAGLTVLLTEADFHDMTRAYLARAHADNVAHAGEEGPAAYVAATLDLLKVERIDHGVRCAEDPALVARLAKVGTPLTVCPLSNVQLQVFPSLAAHNVKRLLDAGLCVTIN